MSTATINDRDVLVRGYDWYDAGPAGRIWRLRQGASLYTWPDGSVAELVIKSSRGAELLSIDSTGSAGNRLVVSGTDIYPDVVGANTLIDKGTHVYGLKVTLPDSRTIPLVARRQIVVVDPIVEGASA
ncbi:MAG: hypothetical protein KDA05_12315 [Phycisphaerales bacterium]|nr:hypothetical protein [Phycisphaerales bacterium]